MTSYGRNSKLWWAFRHLDGSIHVKRYVRSGSDRVEAEASPYVEDIWGPYACGSYDEARAEAEAVLGDSYN